MGFRPHYAAEEITVPADWRTPNRVSPYATRGRR